MHRMVKGRFEFCFFSLISLIAASTTLIWNTNALATMSCSYADGVYSCVNGTGSANCAHTVTEDTTINVDGDLIEGVASGTGPMNAAIGLYNDGTDLADLTINIEDFRSFASANTIAAVDAYNKSGGNSTVTIGSGTGTISNSGTAMYSLGVRARCDNGGDAKVLMNGGNVNTTGDSSWGIESYGLGNAGNVEIVMNGGQIATSGDFSSGLFAPTQYGNSTISISGDSSITTTGTRAHGAYSMISNANGTGNAEISMTGGDVNSVGSGLQAENEGSGNATISIGGDSSITVEGTTISRGAYSHIYNPDSTGDAVITMSGGEITAMGENDFGLAAVNKGLGSAIISISGNSNIISESSTRLVVHAAIQNVLNSSSVGAYMGNGIVSPLEIDGKGIRAYTWGTGLATVAISGGSVTTTGNESYAVGSRSDGGNALIEITGGSITANDGLAISGWTQNNSDRTDLGTKTINISGGTITGGTAAIFNDYGISTTSISGDTTTLTGDIVLDWGEISTDDQLTTAQTLITDSADTITISGGTITGDIYTDGSLTATGGNTLSSGAAAGDILAETAGNDTVAIYGGTIAGDIYNGGGNDTLILGGGSVTGDLYGEENDDTYTISGTTLTGDFHGGEGSDVFVFTAGSVTGDVHGDEGIDTFTWTGGELNCGFYGGDGSDIAVVSASDYDGHQVFDGGDDTSVADGYIDELTFSGVAATANGADILNWETMALDQGAALTIGDGSIAVGDGSENTGIYATNNSILDGGSGLTITGNLDIDSSSQFIGRGAGSGVYAVTGNLNNAGTINTTDGAAGDKVTVGGNYSGGGTLRFDTDFSTGATDNLSVTGNVSMDNATIEINGLASTTSSTSSEIVLIDAPNDSDKSDEHFVLAESNRYDGNSNLGRWAGSPFIWKLKNSDGNCVLGDAYELPSADTGGDDPGGGSRDDRSSDAKPAVVSEIPAEVSLPTFAYEVSINKLNTLHKRLGELRKHKAWANFDPASGPAGLFPPVGFDENHLNVWARSTFAGFNIDADDNFEVEGRYGLAQVGFDYKMGDDANTIYAGFYGGYIEGNFDNSGEGGDYGSLFDATTDMDGWAGGIYGTWMNTYGTYVDLVIDYTMLEAKIESVDTLNTDGETISGSIEAGQSLTFMHKLVLEPQLQVKVAHVTWDSFHDGYSDVTFDDHTYVTGRAGLRTEYTMFRTTGLEIKPWLYAGAQHEFTDDPNITNVIDFKSHDYDTTGNVQVGITWEDTDMFVTRHIV